VKRGSSKPEAARTGAARTKIAKSGARLATDWPRLRAAKAQSIRQAIEGDGDARATDDAFWKDAKVVMPARKEIVTMRLDADLLRWFRQQRGYQTRINAILRAYMKSRHSAGT
jgi:uncharacterized protein (DUF4415 family)